MGPVDKLSKLTSNRRMLDVGENTASFATSKLLQHLLHELEGNNRGLSDDSGNEGSRV
jgi:hypothetical protein